MIARLPYTHPSVRYGTIFLPLSRYPLEREGMKIKKFIGCKFTHLRETDNVYKDLKCVGVGVIIIGGSMELPLVVSK
jgi:hypothetical protein